jgi:hypothetical protein
MMYVDIGLAIMQMAKGGTKKAILFGAFLI